MKAKLAAISKFMTPAPATVEVGSSLEEAADIMEEHGVRHLPVVQEGKLVGVLSQREVRETLADEAGERFVVDDVMVTDAYSVTPDVPLLAVLEEMGAEKYGCVVIKEETGAVAGIFTLVDACRLLAETLKAL